MVMVDTLAQTIVNSPAVKSPRVTRHRPDATLADEIMALDHLRNGNLDLIRAIAISLVLTFHVTQLSPAAFWIGSIAAYGQYGVDLFFVLSGWLIGGLYWRERKTFGNVQIWRFWTRRWMRTIPPYLAALILSYVAVYITRAEPFNYGYLIFVQNYYANVPYFLVSWSLCVEEHFYLATPIILLAFRNIAFTKVKLAAILALLLIVPALLRFLGYANSLEGFGYAQTATHLRWEGLVFGFSASYLSIERPEEFRVLSRASPYLLGGFGSCFLLLTLAGGRWTYSFAGTVVAVLFCSLLIFLFSRGKRGPIPSRLVRPIAITSYSMYLTHALAIHIALQVIHILGVNPWVSYFPVTLILIAAGSTIFYFMFEKSSIALRDRLWPRRSSSAG
jgi:peptidoglycan/LPS O-acetylase OafA/YrhL